MPTPFDTPGYRYATQRFPSDGVQTDFEFNFAGGYLYNAHVTVWLQDLNLVQTKLAPSMFTLIGPFQVRLLDPAPAGYIVVIRRDTDKDLPLLDYSDGAILNDTNLNTTNKQAVFVAAEMVDLFADLMTIFGGSYMPSPEFIAPRNPSYICVQNDPVLPNERRLAAGTNISIVDGGPGGDIVVSATGGAGGAPVDATYLVLGANAGLAQERVLTAGANVSFVDGGAGGPLTINASIPGGSGTAAWNIGAVAVPGAGYTNFFADNPVDNDGLPADLSTDARYLNTALLYTGSSYNPDSTHRTNGGASIFNTGAVAYGNLLYLHGGAQQIFGTRISTVDAVNILGLGRNWTAGGQSNVIAVVGAGTTQTNFGNSAVGSVLIGDQRGNATGVNFGAAVCIGVFDYTGMTAELNASVVIGGSRSSVTDKVLGDMKFSAILGAVSVRDLPKSLSWPACADNEGTSERNEVTFTGITTTPATSVTLRPTPTKGVRCAAYSSTQANAKFITTLTGIIVASKSSTDGRRVAEFKAVVLADIVANTAVILSQTFTDLFSDGSSPVVTWAFAPITGTTEVEVACTGPIETRFTITLSRFCTIVSS